MQDYICVGYRITGYKENSHRKHYVMCFIYREAFRNKEVEHALHAM